MATSASAVMAHVKRLEKARPEGGVVEGDQPTTPPPPAGKSARRSSDDGAPIGSMRGSSETNKFVKDPSKLNGHTVNSRNSSRQYGNSPSTGVGDKGPSASTAAGSKSPPAWLAAKTSKSTEASKSSVPEFNKPIGKYSYSLPSKTTSETGNSNNTSIGKNFSHSKIGTPAASLSSGRVSKLAEPSKSSTLSKQEDDTKTGSKLVYSLPKKSKPESSLTPTTKSTSSTKGANDADAPKSYASSKYPYSLPSKSTPTATSSKPMSASKKPDPPLKTLDGNSSKTSSSSLPKVTLKPTNSAAAAELKRQKAEEEQEEENAKLSKKSQSQRRSSLPPPGSAFKPSPQKTSAVETNRKLNDGAIDDHVKRLRETTSAQPKSRAGNESDPYLDSKMKRFEERKQKTEQQVKKADESKKNAGSNDEVSPRQERRRSNEQTSNKDGNLNETEDLSKAVADKKKWLKTLTHEIVAERSQWLEEEKAKAAKDQAPTRDLESSLSRLPMYDTNELMNEIQQSNAILESIKQRTAIDVQSVDTLTLGGLSMASKDTNDEQTQDNRNNKVETVNEEEVEIVHEKPKDDSESSDDDEEEEEEEGEDEDDDDDDEEEDEEEESEDDDSDDEDEEEEEETHNEDSAELEAATLAGLNRAQQDAAPYQMKADPPGELSNKDDDDEEDDKTEEADEDEEEEEEEEQEDDKGSKLMIENVAGNGITRASKDEPAEVDDHYKELGSDMEVNKALEDVSERKQNKAVVNDFAVKASSQVAVFKKLTQIETVKEPTHIADVKEPAHLYIVKKPLQGAVDDSALVNESKIPALVNEDKLPALVQECNIPAPVNEAKTPTLVNEAKTPTLVNEAKTPTLVSEAKTPTLVNEAKDEDERDAQVEENKNDAQLEDREKKSREKKKDKKSKRDRHSDEKKRKDKKREKREKKREKKKAAKEGKYYQREEKQGLLSSHSDELAAESTDDDEEAFESNKQKHDPPSAYDDHNNDPMHDGSANEKVAEAQESATTEAEMAKAADQSGCGCIIL